MIDPIGKFGRAALVTMVLATAACGHKTPTGQTVAVVNGDEITLGDLNLELAALPPQQRDSARPRLIKALVSRKLFAQDAQKKGVDKTPDFILQVRRTRELLLAQRVLQTSAALSQQQITDADLTDYVNRHSNIGALHAILLVDQVQFRTPGTPAKLDALKPAKTLAALVAVLKAQGIAAKAARAQIDTAVLSEDVLAKIAALQPGEPLIAVDGARSVASAIVETRPAPIPLPQAKAIARKQIEESRLKDRIEQYDRALRNTAKIVYADKYAPTD